jgi:serine/threonine-protein kinase
VIDPPKGLVNVNARPWADVLIDGEMVGQTPLSNLALPLGSHQITFRHPQLGERSERIMVTTRGVNRVAVDFNK